MKKLLLLLIVIIGASQLKAQQNAIKPFDRNLFKAPKHQSLPQFNIGDSTLFKNFSAIPNGQLFALTPNNSLDYKIKQPIVNNIDHMPIAKVGGNIDHMPIAKVSGDIDKMPGSVVVVPKPVTP